MGGDKLGLGVLRFEGSGGCHVHGHRAWQGWNAFDS